MPKAAQQIRLKYNNPCLFTAVRETQFTALIDTSQGYSVRECGTEVADRRVLMGG